MHWTSQVFNVKLESANWTTPFAFCDAVGVAVAHTSSTMVLTLHKIHRVTISQAARGGRPPKVKEETANNPLLDSCSFSCRCLNSEFVLYRSQQRHCNLYVSDWLGNPFGAHSLNKQMFSFGFSPHLLVVVEESQTNYLSLSLLIKEDRYAALRLSVILSIISTILSLSKLFPLPFKSFTTKPQLKCATPFRVNANETIGFKTTKYTVPRDQFSP